MAPRKSGKQAEMESAPPAEESAEDSREFPKMLYARGGKQLIVKDAHAQAKAGDTWHEHPDEV